jgi:hypothetical protein
VIRRCGVATSVGVEVAPERGNGEDDISWADANLTGPKIKKIHVVDSSTTNRHERFKIMMS